jgi:hypothetical protein
MQIHFNPLTNQFDVYVAGELAGSGATCAFAAAIATANTMEYTCIARRLRHLPTYQLSSNEEETPMLSRLTSALSGKKAKTIDIGWLDNAWTVADVRNGRYTNYRQYTDFADVLREVDRVAAVVADELTAERIRQARPAANVQG